MTSQPILYGCQIKLTVYDTTQAGGGMAYVIGERPLDNCYIDGYLVQKVLSFIITPVPASGKVIGDQLVLGGTFLLKVTKQIGGCLGSFVGPNESSLLRMDVESNAAIFSIKATIPPGPVITSDSKFFVFDLDDHQLVMIPNLGIGFTVIPNPQDIFPATWQFINVICPTTDLYKCTDNTRCEKDVNGTLTEDECLNSCGVVEGKTFNCKDGGCVAVDGAGGTYLSLSECNESCGGGGESHKYRCDTNTGTCIVDDVNGAYNSTKECGNFCAKDDGGGDDDDSGGGGGITQTSIIFIVVAVVVAIIIATLLILHFAAHKI